MEGSWGAVALLVPWLMLVVMATLGPFNFEATSPVSFLAGGHASSQHDPMHVLLNALLFVPLGALVHHGGRRQSLTLCSTFILGGAAAFVISFAVEFVQLFIPSRESSLVDLAANTAGGLVGVVSARAWGISIAAQMDRLRARISASMFASLMAGLTVL